MIISQELGTSLRMTSGPALERAGDLAAMLSNLMEGDVLFIDEIHRIARPAEEMLYMAMEDFRIDVIVGKGPGATSIPWRFRRLRWSGRQREQECSPVRCGIASVLPPRWSTTAPRISPA